IVLDVAPGPARPADEALDAFLSLQLRTARLLRDSRELSPLRVELERVEPSPSEPFRRFFRAPVRFAARMNFLELARSDFEATLPARSPDLARQIDEVLGRSVARLDQQPIVGLARSVIAERLPDGEPSERSVARTLGMSTRTLQRRLTAAGAS